ncbi:MAG: TonB family protein [Steroidobacteraceae bacterium]
MPSAASRSSRNPVAAAPAGASGTPANVQPTVDVTAITSRDDFLLELGQTLGGQASIRPVDSVEAALSSLAATHKRGQVLVLDALQANEVRPTVDAVQGRAPHAVMLVFVAEALERQVAAAVKGSKVFALLPSPIDARKTQAVFAGVIEEATARRSTAAASAAAAPAAEFTLGTFSPRSPEALALEERGGKSRLVLIVGGVVAALAVAGGAAWYFTRGNGTPPVTAVAPVAAPAAAAAAPAAEPALAPAPSADLSIVHGKVDELLEKARLAMRERRYTEPAGDNALLYYRSAVAANASNGEARDGLQRVAGVIAGRFDDALNAGHLDEAAQNLANFKAAMPDDPRVADLSERLVAAQLTKALADGSLERAVALLHQAQQAGSLPADQLAKWQKEIARRQDDARVQRLAAVVEERIHDGKLVDPADDSARYYVHQLSASSPTNPNTQRAEHDLAAACLHKARDAALAKNSAEQDRWLSEARDAGATAADISNFQHDLVAARAKAAQAEGDRLAQLARDRTRDGRLTDPAQDSAAYYLTQLQSTDPDNAALAPASHDLAKLLLDRARATLQTGKSADQDLGAARHWGADPKDIAAVQQAAQPKAASVDPASLAASLKPVKTVPPEYPQSALDHRVAGSVILGYTVDTKGGTRDVQVLQSTPPGTFDRAAVSAVRRWRYQPVLVNGAAVEVPTKTLVRFELPKQ